MCVDLPNDPANCGACGNVCDQGAGELCVGGVCESPTESCEAQGLTNCGGFCLNTTTDTGNCGGCGNVCGQTQDCVGSVCQDRAEPAGECFPLGTQCALGGECCSNSCNEFGFCD